MKRIRVALTALIVGGFMFATSSPAFAEQAFAEVTCATPDGTEQTFSIGWDNSNQFFDGRGEIPRLYCEGGYANGYPIYVRDNLPADSPLRWYNGIAPVVELTPEPTLEPTPEIIEPTPVVTQSPEPEPTASVVPSLNPEPTPTPEPSQSESPSIEPTPEATESTEPVITPTVEPEPAPTPSVSEIAPVPVVKPTPTPSLIEPTPTPSESVQEVVQVEPVAPNLVPDLVPAPPVVVIDQTVALEVPALLDGVIGITAIFEAAEAFMNIGSDMTPEQRDESQSVVVAAVIVGQLAMRKTK
jgi:hypothetical protein